MERKAAGPPSTSRPSAYETRLGTRKTASPGRLRAASTGILKPVTTLLDGVHGLNETLE